MNGKQTSPATPGFANHSNPFSTRFVRPGALDYLFDEPMHAVDLVQRLASLNWRAQIVGPHGSGKSTLVASLLEPLGQASRAVRVFRLCEGEVALPAGWNEGALLGDIDLIIVDGFEQLSWWRRSWLKLRTRRWNCGLLVTAHRDMGMATLYRTQTSLRTALAVVERIAPHGNPAIGAEGVAQCFASCKGNIRETLFALYDLYEAHDSAGQNANVHRDGQNDFTT